jgi:hypothetical protein
VLKYWIRAIGSWKLEIGNWKSETGNRKLEIGNRKLETGNWKRPHEPEKVMKKQRLADTSRRCGGRLEIQVSESNGLVQGLMKRELGEKKDGKMQV